MKRKPVPRRATAGTSKAEAEKRKALFVEAMIANGGNQTQAAIAAGYPAKSAHVRGAELVKDSRVAGLLEQRRAEALSRGLADLASRFVAVETMSAAKIALLVVASIAFLEDRPEHRPLATQLEMVAMNLKNLR